MRFRRESPVGPHRSRRAGREHRQEDRLWASSRIPLNASQGTASSARLSCATSPAPQQNMLTQSTSTSSVSNSYTPVSDAAAARRRVQRTQPDPRRGLLLSPPRRHCADHHWRLRASQVPPCGPSPDCRRWDTPAIESTAHAAQPVRRRAMALDLAPRSPTRAPNVDRRHAGVDELSGDIRGDPPSDLLHDYRHLRAQRRQTRCSAGARPSSCCRPPEVLLVAGRGEGRARSRRPSPRPDRQWSAP